MQKKPLPNAVGVLLCVIIVESSLLICLHVEYDNTYEAC